MNQAKSRVENIKQQIFDLKEKINEAEEREANAKRELAEVKARHTLSESDAMHKANRRETLQNRLNDVNKRLSESVSQLDENDLRSKESEDGRKRLQDKEEEGFENLNELESAVKTLKFEKEEKDNIYREAVLREKALTGDLNRVEGNLKRATEKSESLEKELNDKLNITKDKEEKVNELNEREDNFKEIILTLDEKVKRQNALGEENNAKEKSIQRVLDRMHDDIKREKEKQDEIEKHFEEIDQGI